MIPSGCFPIPKPEGCLSERMYVCAHTRHPIFWCMCDPNQLGWTGMGRCQARLAFGFRVVWFDMVHQKVHNQSSAKIGGGGGVGLQFINTPTYHTCIQNGVHNMQTCQDKAVLCPVWPPTDSSAPHPFSTQLIRQGKFYRGKSYAKLDIWYFFGGEGGGAKLRYISCCSLLCLALIAFGQIILELTARVVKSRLCGFECKHFDGWIGNSSSCFLFAMLWMLKKKDFD